jgi:hypothetical protein
MPEYRRQFSPQFKAEAVQMVIETGTCRARIHDRGGDLLLVAAGPGCQAAMWYSCVSPPRTCFRAIRCSARLICGGRVSLELVRAGQANGAVGLCCSAAGIRSALGVDGAR